MSINGVNGRTTYVSSMITNLRSQLDQLSVQLATGKVSNDYAGQGSERGLAVTLRSQILNMSTYADTAVNVNTRLGVANLSLERLIALGTSVKGAAVSASATIDNTGKTAAQKTAQLGLIDSIDMLNARAGDRYLFGGRATDGAPVVGSDMLLQGKGPVAGLEKVIDERTAADLGDGMGRLVLGPLTGTAMSLSEDVAGSIFGLKLTSASTTITGATVTGPTGAPPQIDIDLNGVNPTEGQMIALSFTLPDGTVEELNLKATAVVPVPRGGFAIGADADATAANLHAALATGVQDLAKGTMAAASAVQAGRNFFDQPPMRVDVSALPLGQATALVAGTPADTVFWYKGETGTDLARNTATAKIDDNIFVSYGIRADEQGLRNQLESIAVFAAVRSDVADVHANDKIGALNQRIAQNMAVAPGQQSIQGIQADVAGAQATIKSATERHTQTKGMAETMLAHIEAVNKEEVATKIIALQTSLEASYATTSKLYKLSLVNFI